MKVDIQLLPAISRIVEECEDDLRALIGSPVKVRLMYVATDINEESIQNHVCDQFNVYWHEVVAETRKAEAVRARHAYWWLCMKWLDYTCTYLAKKFDKDHTTILHGVGRIQKLLDAKDSFISMKIKNIENIIGKPVEERLDEYEQN